MKPKDMYQTYTRYRDLQWWLLAGLFMLLGVRASAQLTVAPQPDMQALQQALEGQGVRVENLTVTCHDEGFGEFDYAGDILGATEGVLLTTGRISNAIGPNNVENRSFPQNTAGDPVLEIVTGRTTHDACRMEFDLIPSGDSISFDFVLGSEEYHEWVGSQYNDVFGFFISGPGIIGDPGIGDEKNIALIPGSTDPVSINSVNNGSNSQYFYDNTGGSQIQYDGITQGLKAVSAVQPCETYHMKIVIADASDRTFDSGVFIQKIKSNNVTMQAFTTIGIPQLVEGCNSGFVRFGRAEASPFPLQVDYFIQGTATNGTDYVAIGDIDPNTPKQVTIPAGAAYVDVPVDPLSDGVSEGAEYLRFILGDPSCPATLIDSIDLPIVDELPVTVTPANTTICPGGLVQYVATGGGSYTWSPATGLNDANSANPTATPASSTTYTVTITNGACSRSVERTVTVSNIQLTAIATRPLCHGGSNGAINLSISGGTPPYSISWSGPGGYTATTEDLVNITSGSYTATVTDANGCTKVQSFNVNTPAQLAATTSTTVLPFGQNIACFNGTTNIGLTVTGGTAPYSYAWTGPGGYTSTQQNLNNVGAGDYSVTITDQNGCTVTATRTLSQPPQLQATISDVTHVACHGQSTGSATVEVSGGMPPYSFHWNSSPAQTGATATGLPAGSRTVTVTDGYGCTTTANVVIQQPASPLSITLTDVSHVVQCQGQNNPHGSGTAVASGGTAPYNYHWNTVPVQHTAEAEFTSGGTYVATITDANGCSVSTSVTVTQPGESALVLEEQVDVLCNGTSTGGATVSVTGGSNVQSIVWNTEPPQYGFTLSGVPAGTYNAIAQHANGCQSSLTITITEPSDSIGTPAVVADAQGISCFGASDGSISLDASGGTAPYEFHYDGSVVPGDILNDLAVGDHWITVFDANGCTSSTSIAVAGPAAPLSVAITGFTNELCFGGAQGTASAAASGGTAPYTYEWDTDPVQTGSDATDLEQGTYTVTATDANGCTASADVTISGPQFGIEATIVEYGNVSCFGADDGWATVFASGGSNSFTITWNTEPPIIGATATGLSPGLYEVEVVDNNGCDTPKILQVGIDGPAAALTHTITVSDHNGWNTSCAGAYDGWIDLEVNGGTEPYNYTWSDDFGNVAGMEDPSGIDAGTYYITIGDAYGCSITDTVIITAPPPLDLDFDISIHPGGHHISCAGADDGSADMTISGGTPPYAISWSNGQGFLATTEDISGLGAGVYAVEVTDANGCVITGTITLTSPPAIDLQAVIGVNNGYNISCHGGNDGSIDLTISGGMAPFSYDWSNGAVQEDPSGLTAGTHSVIVTDANGCTATANYVLDEAPELLVDVEVAAFNGGHNTSCNGSSDGSVNSSISGGIAPYSVVWNGPGGYTSTDEDPSGLAAGTYAITVTDGNGCIAEATAPVTEPAAIEISLSSTAYNEGFNISCNGGSNGSISSSIVGGVAAYTLLWNGPNGYSSSTPDPTGLVAGEHTLHVTDANGCTADASITLTEPGPLAVTLDAPDILPGYQASCTGGDGSISTEVTGGTPVYQFSWNGPGGFGSIDEDISGLNAGDYTLTVMDANGCSVDGMITLTGPSAITLEFNTTDNECPGGNGAAISSTVSGGAGGYQFDWSGPGGYSSAEQDPSGLAAGHYSLLITDALGCTATSDVVLTDPEPLSSGTYVSFYGEFNLQCIGDSSGVIELTPAGGTAPYTIATTGPGSFASSTTHMTGLVAGAYQVSITDQNGCVLDTTIMLTEPTEGVTAEFTLSEYPSGTNVSCHGGNDGWIDATIEGGNGPYEIFWRGPDSLEWEMEDIYDLPAGDYSYELVVIDANQCTFSTEITLTQPDSAMSASSILSQYGDVNISCTGSMDGSIDLEVAGGSGGFTYAWTGPNGALGTDQDLSGIGSGAYTATITDMNGCTLEHPVVLLGPEAVSIVLSTANIACHGEDAGVIQADITGGTGVLHHTWSGNGIDPDAPLEVEGLTAGSYCIDVFDDHGCTAQECITISEPAGLTASTTTTSAECGSTSGTIDLEVQGGVAPYAYHWSNGSNVEDPSELPMGQYEVTITDANGCTLTVDDEVGGSPGVSTTAVITDIACNGAMNGAIDLDVIGGTAPFEISWSNGMTTEDPTGLDQGDYTVSITDQNGCSSTASYTVAQSEGIVITPVVSVHPHGHNIGQFGGNDGSISITVEGGVGPYAITWSNGSDSEDQTGLSAGEHTVEVIDVYGCTAMLTITLTEPMDLEMPTGYSPNSDGANDVFHIRGLEAYPDNRLTVFNRWGNVVFDRLNYKNDWAGDNSNGEELPNGTYFVILTVNNGTRTLQGYVDMRR